MTFNNFSEFGETPEKIGLSFTTYKNTGGILTKESYEAIADAQKQSSIDKFNRPTLAQVTGMATRNKIPVDEDTRVIYGILRTEIKNVPSVDEKDASTITRFSDKEVFAEALLFLGRLEEHASFVSAYPNIFDNPNT